jgi:hypothetical protein
MYENCDTNAHYGLRGCRATFCGLHKDDEIFVYTYGIKCHFPGCGNRHEIDFKFCATHKDTILCPEYLEKVRTVLKEKKLYILFICYNIDRKEVVEVYRSVIPEEIIQKIDYSFVRRKSSKRRNKKEKIDPIADDKTEIEDQEIPQIIHVPEIINKAIPEQVIEDDTIFITKIIDNFKSPYFLARINTILGDVTLSL